MTRSREQSPTICQAHVLGTYEPGHVFTPQEFEHVTPKQIFDNPKLKVYGWENTQPDINPPLHYRSNTIKYWKKFGATSCQITSRLGTMLRNVQSHTQHSREQASQGCDKEGSCSCWPSFSGEMCLPVIQVCAHDISMPLECPAKETGKWLAAYSCYQYNIIPRLNAAHRISIRPNHSHPTTYQFACAGRMTSWMKETPQIVLAWQRY